MMDETQQSQEQNLMKRLHEAAKKKLPGYAQATEQIRSFADAFPDHALATLKKLPGMETRVAGLEEQRQIDALGNDIMKDIIAVSKIQKSKVRFSDKDNHYNYPIVYIRASNKLSYTEIYRRGENTSNKTKLDSTYNDVNIIRQTYEENKYELQDIILEREWNDKNTENRQKIQLSRRPGKFGTHWTITRVNNSKQDDENIVDNTPKTIPGTRAFAKQMITDAIPKPTVLVTPK